MNPSPPWSSPDIPLASLHTSSRAITDSRGTCRTFFASKASSIRCMSPLRTNKDAQREEACRKKNKTFFITDVQYFAVMWPCTVVVGSGSVRYVRCGEAMMRVGKGSQRKEMGRNSAPVIMSCVVVLLTFNELIVRSTDSSGCDAKHVIFRPRRAFCSPHADLEWMNLMICGLHRKQCWSNVIVGCLCTVQWVESYRSECILQYGVRLLSSTILVILKSATSTELPIAFAMSNVSNNVNVGSTFICKEKRRSLSALVPTWQCVDCDKIYFWI